MVRLRALDAARWQGRFVIRSDGSGYLAFRRRHGAHGLTRPCGATTRYRHQVREAKRVGPGGRVLSIATAFIDNRDAADTPAAAGQEQRKQDGARKALRRRAARRRQDFPPRPLGTSGDGLHAGGEAFPIAKG